MSPSNYHELSIIDPEYYWKQQAKLVAWYKTPQAILSTNAEGYHQWFADGELNTSYLTLDYHVE